MFEFAGLIMTIIAGVDVYLGNGKSFNHFLIALILIITSMCIKSHKEIVKISNYIGDSKKYQEDRVEMKEE